MHNYCPEIYIQFRKSSIFGKVLVDTLKLRNETVFGWFTVIVLVLQCFLYTHAFIMASCVTLLLYCKVVFLNEFLL